MKSNILLIIDKILKFLYVYWVMQCNKLSTTNYNFTVLIWPFIRPIVYKISQKLLNFFKLFSVIDSRTLTPSRQNMNQIIKKVD